MFDHPKPSTKINYLQITALLLLGFVIGLVFLFALPPWQHYDEPNHFEYVWLAANLDHLPQPGDYDLGLSQQVMTSMGLHRFWGDKQKLVFEPDQKITIQGYSQLHEPPFYYVVASLPLRFLRTESIEIQLYAARMVSLLFFLITIFSAWNIARELTPEKHTLRWLLPLSLILLPSFTDLMTAVNSDAAAVGVASLFIWISTRLLMRGFSWISFFWLCFFGVLAIFTKNTAMFVIAIFPLVFLFSWIRAKRRIWAWSGIFLVVMLGLVLSLALGDPKDWLRGTLQPESIRMESQQAVHGDHVFALKKSGGKSPDWWPIAAQSLPLKDSTQLKDQELTLGFWAWADHPTEINSPILNKENASFSTKVGVDTNPQFFSFSFQPEGGTNRMWLSFDPRPGSKTDYVFYDGLVLIIGKPGSNIEPRFIEPGGETIDWDGVPYSNWIRNPSAEYVTIKFNSVIDQYGSKLLPDGMTPSLLLEAAIDYQGMMHIHFTALERLFRNFWGKFAWGHVGLSGWTFFGRPYFWLAIFSVLGLLGAIVAVLRRIGRLDKTFLLIFFLLLVLVWGVNFLRGVPYVVNDRLYLSVARHAFPVIIPTMLFLVVGWSEIIEIFASLWRGILRLVRIKDSHQELLMGGFYFVLYGALVLVWIGLTAGALVSILQYYNKLHLLI